jgi:hypothetical protein
MKCHDTYQSYTISPKQKVAKYTRHTRSWWQESYSSPRLILLDTTYVNMISVLVEDDRYITIITTYPPSGACVFNVARTTLHML